MRCVMKCHVLSCSAGTRPSPPALRRLCRPHPAYRSSIAFRSLRAAAGLPAARPFSARIAGAPAPAFAPARFARLIARASQAQGASLPFVPLGVFRTGAKRETKRPPDAASCPILPQFYRGQALFGNYFIIHEQIVAAERTSCLEWAPEAGRPHLARPFPKTASPNSLYQRSLTGTEARVRVRRR